MHVSARWTASAVLHRRPALYIRSLVAFVMAQSNFDRRRINGPEESVQPVFDLDEEEETRWKPGSARKGRGARDIRPICMHILSVASHINMLMIDRVQS